MAENSPEPTSLAAQWDAFTRAPLLYLGEVIVVAGLAWAAAWLILKNRYEGTIDGLEQRLALAKEQFEASNSFAGKVDHRLDEIDRRLGSLEKTAQAEQANQIAALSSALRSDIVELVKANDAGLSVTTSSGGYWLYRFAEGYNQTPLPLRDDGKKSGS